MAINASQILLRTRRTAKLLKAVEGYLSKWVRAAKAEWPAVPFLGTDAARHTWVLHRGAEDRSKEGGWFCVLDADPDRADHDLAAHLSGVLGARVLVAELAGGRLTWAVAVIEAGRRLRAEREPPEAFEDGAVGMPLYPDATGEILRALRPEGVPAELRLLRQDEFEEGAEPEPLTGEEPEFAVERLVSWPEKKAVRRLPSAVVHLRRRPGAVPFRPDVEGEGEGGRALFVEIRSLIGTPDSHAVHNLLEIERLDRNRLLAPYIDWPAEKVPEVRFEYSSRDVADRDFQAQIDLRREDYFRSRPPKREFLRVALSLAAREHPEWRPRPGGFGLRIDRPTPARAGESPASETSLAVSALYEDLMAGRIVSTGPEEAIGEFLAGAAEDLSRAPSAEFEAVSDLLLPCLAGREEALRLKDEGVALEEFGGGVFVGVACQVGEGSALIDEKDLAKWGLSLDEVLTGARRNLEGKLREGPLGFLPMELLPGRTVLSRTSGGGEHAAELVLLPGLSRIAKELLGSESILCAIPDLNAIFIAPDGDPELAEAMKKLARERMEAASHPLTAELFHVGPEGVIGIWGEKR